MLPLLSGRHNSRRDAYVPFASRKDKKCGNGGNVNESECGGIYQEPYERVTWSYERNNRRGFCIHIQK